MPTNLIGWPVTARIESAAPPRASPSMRVSTMPVMPIRSSKALGELTASWPVMRVGDEQRLGRLRRIAHRRDFLHQRLVDVEPAGGVEDDDVVAFAPAGIERALGDRDRRLPRDDRQRRHADLLRQHRELLLRRRAVHVERRQQDLAPLAVFQQPRELRRGRGFARALQADHHHDDRRHGVEVERAPIDRAPRLSTRWS